MSSHAECWLGSFYVGSTTNDIDPALMLLFRPADRVTTRGTLQDLPFQTRRWTRRVAADDELTVTYYRAPLPIVRDRLELKGYTLDVARTAITTSLEAEAARYRRLAAGSHGELFQPVASLLETANADRWLEALRDIRSKNLEQRHIGEDTQAFAGTLTGYMLEHDWYGYAGPDLCIGLRLAVDVCSDTDEFVYDVTDLVLSEYVTPEEDLVGYALSLTASEYSASGKIMVLTEGRSDGRILAESLRLVFPHLVDYFTFMDFEGARLGGGAGSLANIVKAFAGAGIVTKVIALFDNDTAAEAAMQTLRAVPLPRNIRVMKLPDLPALQHYPTIGPSGMVTMDVNGMAGSIELYLGADVLAAEDGNPTPIQWTGYEASLRKYQGEVMAKERIQDRFAGRLEACKQSPELMDTTDWEGVRAILVELFSAFRHVDAEDIQAAVENYYAR